MEKENYIEWLIKWFSNKIGKNITSIDVDFFKEGWLDSFNTLELVLSIENELHLSLADSVFIDPRFSSIAGLSEILLEIKNS